jgi:hypothetical protein
MPTREPEFDANASAATPTELAEVADEVDLSLLRDSLAKTPWERMRANDDALNFAAALRAAMDRRHATRA